MPEELGAGGEGETGKADWGQIVAWCGHKSSLPVFSWRAFVDYRGVLPLIGRIGTTEDSELG